MASAETSTAKVRVLNVVIDNLTTDELLQRFNEGLLVTPNIDHLSQLRYDKSFYDVYQTARYAVCDSRILFLLSKVLYPHNSLKAQITGSDFFPAFYKYHCKRNDGTKIFLLGGTEESVVTAGKNINQQTNSNIIVATYSPPFGFQNDEVENAKIIKAINDSDAETIAIGVGSPKQEMWVHKHRSKLPGIKRYLAIGATIEFESGNLRRAPRWMTMAGMEWLFRLGQEPRRLARRYLINGIPVIFMLIKQRLGSYQHPFEENK